MIEQKLETKCANCCPFGAPLRAGGSYELEARARALLIWIHRKVFVFEIFGDAQGLFHLDFLGRVV